MRLVACLILAGLAFPRIGLSQATGPESPFVLGDPAVGTAGQERPAPSTFWEHLVEAVRSGRTYLTLYYRYEFADQDTFAKDSHASTLRTVLGHETAPWNGFSALLEIENISIIGKEDAYATAPGGNRPVVPDAQTTEVNQAYLKYAWDEEGQARVGRQGIAFDNHRFIGTVPWRQNYQSYDAASVRHSVGDVDLTYAFVDNVNRIVGDDAPRGDDTMTSHFVHANTAIENVGSVSAYAYLLDYEDVPGLSANTFGARLSGSQPIEDVDLLYTLEFANQRDAEDNPANIDENYSLIELGARTAGVTFKVARESLGGNGTNAFQTPLATLHKFNGWADVFLVTPPGGLVDTYAQIGAEIGKARPAIRYHQFEPDTGSGTYGTEWDAIVTYPLAEGLVLGVKAAFYDRDNFGTDTDRAWLWLSASF